MKLIYTLLTYQMIVQIWEVLFVALFIACATAVNYWVVRMSERNFRGVLKLLGRRDTGETTSGK